MRQRGIDARVVDLVLNEGIRLSSNSNRVLLTRKRLQVVLSEGRIDRGLYMLADRAVPVVCVEGETHLVTTFRVDRRINRRRRRRRRRSNNRHRR
jgi:hypothetical protein